ncbi:MerR family transcriptional regulator [Naasia aerilata]|uniref:MerR family transcriptional regulator n=1 Tax=Naasia aerilata TaxID=1162966 RepID=A0ABN6XTD4_9MICO|nr:MerR family transcriptional regulator [Naasia aerilata]BDZ46890.1 MerR family transcriptional regulator [Naasia aerilata]
MTITAESLSIAQMAEATGLSTHTLRYYEREGLMFAPVDRASSSHRRYTEADVTWVSFLTKLRSTGMPIRDVRRYVELARDGDGTMPERLALLVQHRERVLAQLEEVTASLAAIDYKITLYEGHTS